MIEALATKAAEAAFVVRGHLTLPRDIQKNNKLRIIVTTNFSLSDR